MKKKTFGRFTAIGIAALTAIPAFVIPASAANFVYSDVNGTKTASGTIYYENPGDATVYSTKALCASEKTIDASAVKSSDLKVYVGSVYTYAAVTGNSTDGFTIVLSNTNTDYKIVSSSGSNNNNNNNNGSNNFITNSNLLYAESNNNVYLAGSIYYPNLAAAKAQGYSENMIATQSIPSGYRYALNNQYFSFNTGRYYQTQALAKTNGGTGYVQYISRTGSSTSSSSSTATIYRSSNTGKYYLSYAEAQQAGGTITNSTATVYGNWFNRKTGKFYDLQGSALSDTIDSSDVVYAPSYGYSSNYYNNGYYNNGYYYGYGSYYDPIAMYYYNKANQGTTTGSTTTASSTDPVINGTRVVGWGSIAAQMPNYKNKTLAIKMNESSQITKSVLAAAKKNNVTLKLTMENGATWTIKGSDISTAKTLSLDTIYNTSNIPSSLAKKAKKGATSSAQFSIGQNTSLGLEADLTVNFSKSRSGKTVKLYRYNSSKNTLSLVDTAKINSNGAATFSLTSGGDYIAVIV